MYQDIAPKFFNNQYDAKKSPAPDSPVFCFRGKDVLVAENGSFFEYPKASSWKDTENFRYLFSVDDKDYFLAPEGMLPEFTGQEGDFETKEGEPEKTDAPAFAFRQVQQLYRYRMEPMEDVLAAFTAFQLRNWYVNNAYCGRCGKPTHHHPALRALQCDCCGNLIFPKIAPAIMTAVIDGDRVLVTKYANRAYDYISLVAGFNEAGESLEATVAREVKEEVGLDVKNIRYYGSQPWGIADNLMVGYFCELDGDPDSIELDKTELSESLWLTRDDIPEDINDYTMAYEMLLKFKHGLV